MHTANAHKHRDHSITATIQLVSFTFFNNSSFMNCHLSPESSVYAEASRVVFVDSIYVEDASIRIHFLQCQHQIFTDRIVL